MKKPPPPERLFDVYPIGLSIEKFRKLRRAREKLYRKAWATEYQRRLRLGVVPEGSAAHPGSAQEGLAATGPHGNSSKDEEGEPCALPSGRRPLENGHTPEELVVIDDDEVKEAHNQAKEAEVQ
jgi:hypothetical protein